MANGDLDKAVRDLFGERGERARKQRAAKIAKLAYTILCLKTQLEQAITAMGICLTIRSVVSEINRDGARSIPFGNK